jgi:hypothetical protein
MMLLPLLLLLLLLLFNIYTHVLLTLLQDKPFLHIM